MSEQVCECGHGWEYHGPEVPGCVECRCRALHTKTPMTAEREGLSEEIARVLAEHAKTERFAKTERRGLVTWGVRCICGHEIEWGIDETAHHRAHLTDALADLLAARDRRVRAEALREAADAWPYEVNAETIRREIATLNLRDIPPEYRVDDWLRDRADRIEAP